MARTQKGISAIRIYDGDDNPILVVPVAAEARRIREVMKQDCIKLVWESADFIRLGAGTHVYYGTEDTDKANEPFYLLNPYEPTHKYEQVYTYEPEFHALQDMWQKYPACVYSYGLDGQVTGRELEWSFLGTAEDALFMVEQSVRLETGHELEPSHIGSVRDRGTSAVELQGQSTSIFEVLGKIAEALDTEWRYDPEENRIELGEIRLGTDNFPVVGMTVGADCDNPQVSQNKEDYFTRFYVFGSDRNITQQSVSEITNSAVKRRLPLDSAKYPDGFMDLDILSHPQLEGDSEEGYYLPDGVVYQPRQTDRSRVFPKGLYFDEVYPSSRFYVRKIYKNGKDGKQYLVDENGKVVGDTYYVAVSLTNGEDAPVWNDWSLASVLPGETLEMYFTSGILAGRRFALSAHPRYDGTDTYFYLTPDKNGALTTPNQYMVPRVGDEVTFFGYDFGQIGIDNAKRKLERTATKYLNELVQSNMTYTIKPNVVRFERRAKTDARFSLMPLGQQIMLDYGNGDVSERLRVIKVESALDIPADMTITASAKAGQKGTLSSLTDIVELNRRTEEKKIEDYRQQMLSYSQRSFQQVYETMTQINNYFGDEIKTTQQMQLVAGSEALQFVFLKTPDAMEYESPRCGYDKDSGRFMLALYPDDEREFYVKHMTLGIDAISDLQRTESQRKVWRLTNQYALYQNEDAGIVYLQCPKDTSREDIKPCHLYMTDRKMPIEGSDGFYYLLLGFLSKPGEDGGRSFSPMYGYTEILPGRITTDKIVSRDGKTYFDIAKGEIGGNINFKDSVMTETILIKDGDKVDAEGKPYYIGGISGAADLPTLFTGIAPSVTDEEEVKRIARDEELPVKLTKSGYGSNIGCLYVVDDNIVDVRNPKSGMVRISANNIKDENAALSPLDIAPIVFPAMDNGARQIVMSVIGWDGVSSHAVSSEAVTRTFDHAVNLTIELQPQTWNITAGYSVTRPFYYKDNEWRIIWSWNMNFFIEVSVDGGDWQRRQIFNAGSSHTYEGSGLITETTILQKEVKTNTGRITCTGTTVAVRYGMEFTTRQTSGYDLTRHYNLGSVDYSVTPTLGYSCIRSEAVISNDETANIIASGGITSALNSFNFFKLYPQEGRMALDFRGLFVTEDVELRAGTSRVTLRRFGSVVMAVFKIIETDKNAGALQIPVGYRPVETIAVPCVVSAGSVRSAGYAAITDGGAWQFTIPLASGTTATGQATWLARI